MAVTVSAVVLLLIIVAIMLRTGYLRIGPALAAALLGFFAASTGLAPTINSAISSLASLLAQITA